MLLCSRSFLRIRLVKFCISRVLFGFMVPRERTQRGNAKKEGGDQRSKRSFGAQRRHPSRADAHFASFLGLVRRPRVGSLSLFLVGIFQLIFFPRAPSFPHARALLGHACRAGYRQGVGIYTRGL